MLYFKQYIDDIVLIWLWEEDTSAWDAFKSDLKLGILTWEVNEPSSLVDFLDMTLFIVDGHIETCTYQKPMNLYLYLSPSSAHTRGVMKGTIFGLLPRYKAQNTHRSDCIFFTALLLCRLLARGW